MGRNAIIFSAALTRRTLHPPNLIHPMPHVAIVGATGAVGEEMLLCLEQRSFPVEKLSLLASARSKGKKRVFRGREITIDELTPDSFAGVDIALFSAGGSISKQFGPIAAAAGAVVIDNSSAFRMDPDIPLVVPEINGAAALVHPKNIIANPNCTTIVTLMGVAPLHRAFGLRSLIAASYQAVSGSGAQGIYELESQMRQAVANETIEAKVYSRPIVSNVIPLIGPLEANGYTQEEMKLQNEGRKILGHPGLKASITCVRVPVMRSHSVVVTAVFDRMVSPAEAREVLSHSPGVGVLDDPANLIFPTPLDTTNKDDCLVGRIRQNLVLENALDLWVVGDQVRKGAALNAVQIGEVLLQNH